MWIIVTQEQINNGEAFDIWWKKFAVYKPKKEKPHYLASANIGMSADFFSYPSKSSEPADDGLNVEVAYYKTFKKRPQKQTIEGFTGGQK